MCQILASLGPRLRGRLDGFLLHRVDDDDGACVVEAALRKLTELRVRLTDDVLQPLDTPCCLQLVDILDLNAHVLDRDDSKQHDSLVSREEMTEEVVKRAGLLEQAVAQACLRIKSRRGQIPNDADGQPVDLRAAVCDQVADDGHSTTRTELCTQRDGRLARCVVQLHGDAVEELHERCVVVVLELIDERRL